MKVDVLLKEIVPAIIRERFHQEEKYPEEKREIASFIMAMRAEMEEVEQAWSKGCIEDMTEEILQVIAVGVACLEQFGVAERGHKKVVLNRFAELLKNENYTLWPEIKSSGCTTIVT